MKHLPTITGLVTLAFVAGCGGGTSYDIAPTEEPDVKESWLGLLRATVRIPDDVAHLR